jgi:hypothetical protein
MAYWIITQDQIVIFKDTEDMRLFWVNKAKANQNEDE